MGRPAFFFGFFALEDGTDTLSCNVSTKLPDSRNKNPEECSSLFMCSSLDFANEPVCERFAFIKVLLLWLQIKYTTSPTHFVNGGLSFLAGIY
jgi:hypothetical protein